MASKTSQALALVNRSEGRCSYIRMFKYPSTKKSDKISFDTQAWKFNIPLLLNYLHHWLLCYIHIMEDKTSYHGLLPEIFL